MINKLNFNKVTLALFYISGIVGVLVPYILWLLIGNSSNGLILTTAVIFSYFFVCLSLIIFILNAFLSYPRSYKVIIWAKVFPLLICALILFITDGDGLAPIFYGLMSILILLVGSTLCLIAFLLNKFKPLTPKSK